MAEPPVIFAIAGSDPSGGAGIQADLKTFASLGVYGAAAITCLTVQNTQGVRSFTPLARELVREQIRTVLDDLPVRHIKIGMVGSAEIAAAIAETLADFTGEVIYDPVLRAGAGQSLLEGEARSALTHLLDRATVLTPNLPELAALSGPPCATAAEISAAVATLFHRHPRLAAMVVTGGHRDEAGREIIDLLCQRNADGTFTTTEHRHPRLASRNLHGTGCTFASAFAAWHALTGAYETAFHKASAFVAALIAQSASTTIGRGAGPLLHHRARRNP
ncbi:MAG: bifunctional hydroxymethylpyrimidine kinase/phosphomethylpyrimidine kinase [Thermodesulfobacteriota bacterium]